MYVTENGIYPPSSLLKSISQWDNCFKLSCVRFLKLDGAFFKLVISRNSVITMGRCHDTSKEH